MITLQYCLKYNKITLLKMKVRSHTCALKPCEGGIDLAFARNRDFWLVIHLI